MRSLQNYHRAGAVHGDHDHHGPKEKRREKAAVGDQGTSSTTKEVNNKFMHRDVERERKKQEEISALASLQSLLPLEYIKDKHTTDDHLNGAVKYIKHMQKRLEAMRNHRDRLKMNASSSSNELGADDEMANVNIDPTCFVKVNFLGQEIEILIRSCLACEAFPMSRVLKEILGRGLNAVEVVSSRVDDGSVHKIQVECGLVSVNLLELQNKLENLIRQA